MYSCTLSVAISVIFILSWKLALWITAEGVCKVVYLFKFLTQKPKVGNTGTIYVRVSLSRASFLLQYSWVLTSIRNTDKSLMMMMKSLIIMHDFIWSHWANGRYVSVPVPTVPLPIFPKNSKSTKLAGPLLVGCMYVLAISKDIELWPKNLKDGSSLTQKASFYGNWGCEKNNLRHSIHTALWLHVDDGHNQCYQLYFDCQKLGVDCKNGQNTNKYIHWPNYMLMYICSTKCVAKVGNTGISPICYYVFIL